jgi:hypothetical protein
MVRTDREAADLLDVDRADRFGAKKFMGRRSRGPIGTT